MSLARQANTHYDVVILTNLLHKAREMNNVLARQARKLAKDKAR